MREDRTNAVRVSPAAARTFATAVLEELGAPPEIAQPVGDSLVTADLRGANTHGVLRLATSYDRMITEEHIVPDAVPVVEHISDTAARVDGKMGFGHVTGRKAVEVCVKTAVEHGVAAVGISNGTHLGRIGEWAERAADHDVLFLAFINGGGRARTVAPPGSADRLLSTNPIAVGIPTFGALEFPLVLDIATSQVAHGKITARHVTGDPLPTEWTVDADGQPVTDATDFEEGTGALLPLGGTATGYKGFGLALMAELLAGMMGGNVAGQCSPGSVNNGAAFVAIDPTLFRPVEELETLVSDVIEFIRSATFSETIPIGASASGERGFVPGEAEHQTRQRRCSDGIPYAPETVKLLTDIASKHDVPSDSIPF